jgi:hypothetical protein
MGDELPRIGLKEAAELDVLDESERDETSALA